MPPLPSISVIIPARDAAKTISATLASLVAARDLIREVIDDCSTDRTREAARVAARLGELPLTVIEGEGRGPGAARNLGLGIATGRLIYFIDADDEAIPNGLRRLEATLSGGPDIS